MTPQQRDYDANNKRHILCLSYYYAPLENPGTRRIRAFGRYLPQSGYQPVVLTTSSYGAMDNDLQQLIFRAPDLLDAGRWIARAFAHRNAGGSQSLGTIVTPDSFISRVLEQLLIPDIHVGWLPAAITRGKTLLQTKTFRAIFSSSPPTSSHLAGLALKRISGLPWVADFRDGWMFEPPNRVVYSTPIRRHVEAILERAVITGADRIITVNDVLANDFRRRYPLRAEKVTVISNGYDSADFIGMQSSPDKNYLEIVYTGNLAASEQHRSIRGLIRALDQLQLIAHPMMHHLRLTLVGPLMQTERSLIERESLATNIICAGVVPHRTALQYQLNAAILLLITAPGATSVTTSKLFEYLASGRPILALTGRSAAAALIEELGVGMVVAPDDVDGICRALEVFYRRWQAGELPTHIDERIRRYDRRHLTGELAAIFDDLAGSPSNNGAHRL